MPQAIMQMVPMAASMRLLGSGIEAIPGEEVDPGLV
jgi:hypothetical protein